MTSDLLKKGINLAKDTTRIPKEIMDKTIESISSVFNSDEGFEYRTTGTLMKDYFFKCSICRAEFGKFSNKEDYKKVLQKCNKCERWVCQNCWNHQIGECKACSPVFSPEIIVEKSLKTGLREKINYICAQCREKAGSINSKKYKPGAEKEFVTQCPSCRQWVCGNCWNFEKRSCKNCKPFISPQTRVEKKGLRNDTFFICSRCRNEYGPVKTDDWKKYAATGFKGMGVLGTALTYTGAGAPIGIPMSLGAKGAATTIEKGGKKNIKRDKISEDKNLDLSKKFLGQCPDCNKWVCLDCWNKEKGKCKSCSV